MEDSGLAGSRASDDPAVGLGAVGALHRLAEQVEARSVALARDRGWSWEQTGDALGINVTTGLEEQRSVHFHGPGARRTRGTAEPETTEGPGRESRALCRRHTTLLNQTLAQPSLKVPPLP